MSPIDSNRTNPQLIAAALAVLLAGLLLVACGGSSKGSSSSTATAKASARSVGRLGARAEAIRRCLQENGVKLPKGVARDKLQAALRKCGGGKLAGPARFRRPGASGRLKRFAACMRRNGVSLPAPNTSGRGPVFNTKGIDTTGAAFQAADRKCIGELLPQAGASAGGQAGAPGGASPGP